MRKEFGENPGYRCCHCCNYQKKDRKDDEHLVCIAYDSKGEWDPSETACGLFNVPFRGLRPRRRELIESYKKDEEQTPDPTQSSFFGT